MSKVLNDDGNRDLTASHGGQELIELIGERNIGELVHHEMHMNGESAAVNYIRVVIELLKKLGVEHTDNEVERAVVIGDNGKHSGLLLPQLAEVKVVGLGNRSKAVKVELLQSGHKCDLNGFQGLARTGTVVAVILQGDMVRRSLFEPVEQSVKRRDKLIVILFDFTGSDHFHDHRKVLFLRRRFIMQIENKCKQKHHSRLVPERVLRLTAFGRRILKEVGHELLNIVILMQINERVIAMALFHVDKVKHLDLIALFR